MRIVEAWLLAYLWNAVWELPLLCALGWVSTRMLRPLSALAEYRAWLLTLFAQVLLPACVLPPSWLQHLRFWTPVAAAAGSVQVVFGTAQVAGSSLAASWLRLGLPAAWLLVCSWHAVRFLLAFVAAHRIRTDAMTIDLHPGAAAFLARSLQSLKLPCIPVAVLDRVSGPLTVGWRDPRIVLPPALLARLTSAELEAVLAHECVHVQRHDFAWNCLCEVLALGLRFHPALGYVRSRLAAARELVCDERAAVLVYGREEYARSLMRLAGLLVQRAPALTVNAIGTCDANEFGRRVMRLMKGKTNVGRARRIASVAACGVLAVSACASAMAFAVRAGSFVLAAESSTPVAASEPNRPIRVSGGVMAGNALKKVVPVYPQEAKEQKITGAVVLRAVISAEGKVTGLQAMSGPDVLRASAVTAVQQWEYKPFLLNGNPVAVETTITVTYSLSQ